MFGDDDYDSNDATYGVVFAYLGPDWFIENPFNELIQPESRRIGKEGRSICREFIENNSNITISTSYQKANCWFVRKKDFPSIKQINEQLNAYNNVKQIYTTKITNVCLQQCVVVEINDKWFRAKLKGKAFHKSMFLDSIKLGKLYKFLRMNQVCCVIKNYEQQSIFSFHTVFIASNKKAFRHVKRVIEVFKDDDDDVREQIDKAVDMESIHDITDDLNEFIEHSFRCGSPEEDPIDIDKMLSFNDEDLDENITVDYGDILVCLGFNDELDEIDPEIDIEKIFQDFKSNDLETLPELMISDIDFM